MKIVGFIANGKARLGVVDGERLVDLHAVDNRLPGNLADILESEKGDLSSLADLARKAPASAHRDLDGITYGMPVSGPRKVICLGLNYLDHVKEGPQRDNVPKYPSLFFRVLTSLVGHEQPLIVPRASVQLDYEAEMIAVVGRRARDLTMDNALSCIAGYSCGNEGSVREFQRHTTQWTMGKNFDKTGSVGPWLVTADELPPGGIGLSIQTRLNGHVMQSDNTSNMMFPLAETLVYLTKGITLEPGDVIFTGTPSGVGHARKPQVWMKPGDTVEVDIQNIGVLRNPIAAE
ncbi:MAG: fumarylacetoacetate hydrolase family protein [Rhizobiales bacterium]|nr:fumarylacetoacetate hydrolase family protein [Hyphomicrobiales bacterium]